MATATRHGDRDLSCLQHVLDNLDVTLPDFLFALEHALATNPPTSGTSFAELTESQVARIEELGIVRPPSSTPSPRLRTRQRQAAALAGGIRVAEAAAILDVDESRIRQRIKNRTLYAIRIGRSYTIPKFQFVTDADDTPLQLIPNVGMVIHAIPETLPLISIVNWFRTPNDALTIDGAATTPAGWLLAGADPAVLVDLAAELDMAP